MLSIIVATGLGGEIGLNNKLLWHLKNDMINFKTLTMNHTIIMGRKTYLSLPRRLPNRKHIVLSRQYGSCNDKEIILTKNVNELIDKYQNSDEEVFIIGGEQIYKRFLPYVDKIYLTKVHERFPEADAFFNFDLKLFECIKLDVYKQDENNEYDFVIYELKRIK